MTNDELRSLDAQIALKLMGWTDVRRLEASGNYIGTAPLIEPRNNSNIVPNYSSDMNAAWEVIEKIKASTTHNGKQWSTGKSWITFCDELSGDKWNEDAFNTHLWYVDAHKICKAAIKVSENDKLDSCI
jgi:beta-galactosidase beta subunit